MNNFMNIWKYLFFFILLLFIGAMGDTISNDTKFISFIILCTGYMISVSIVGY